MLFLYTLCDRVQPYKKIVTLHSIDVIPYELTRVRIKNILMQSRSDIIIITQHLNANSMLMPYRAF